MRVRTLPDTPLRTPSKASSPHPPHTPPYVRAPFREGAHVHETTLHLGPNIALRAPTEENQNGWHRSELEPAEEIEIGDDAIRNLTAEEQS